MNEQKFQIVCSQCGNIPDQKKRENYCAKCGGKHIVKMPNNYCKFCTSKMDLFLIKEEFYIDSVGHKIKFLPADIDFCPDCGRQREVAIAGPQKLSWWQKLKI